MNWFQTSSGVPILSKHELEYVADLYTQEFVHFVKKDEPSFSVWKFAVSFLKKAVSFEYLSNNSCILGMSVFVDNT